MLRELSMLSCDTVRSETRGDWFSVMAFVRNRRWALASAALVETHYRLVAQPDISAYARQVHYVSLIVLLSIPSVDISSEDAFSDPLAIEVLQVALTYFVRSRDAPPSALRRLLMALAPSLQYRLITHLVFLDEDMDRHHKMALNVVIHQSNTSAMLLREIAMNRPPPRDHLGLVGILPGIAAGAMTDVCGDLFHERPLAECDGIFWCIHTVMQEVNAEAIDCDLVALKLSIVLLRGGLHPPMSNNCYQLVLLLCTPGCLGDDVLCTLLRSLSDVAIGVYMTVIGRFGLDGWPTVPVVERIRDIAESYMRSFVRVAEFAASNEVNAANNEVTYRASILSAHLLGLARLPYGLVDNVERIDELVIDCCTLVVHSDVLAAARILMDALDRPALRVLARCGDASLGRTAQRLLLHWEAWCTSVQTLSELLEAIVRSDLRRADVTAAWTRLCATLDGQNMQGMVEHCPITLELPMMPVACSDGHTYDQRAIVRWMREHDGTSPMTRQPLAILGRDVQAITWLDVMLRTTRAPSAEAGTTSAVIDEHAEAASHEPASKRRRRTCLARTWP